MLRLVDPISIIIFFFFEFVLDIFLSIVCGPLSGPNRRIEFHWDSFFFEFDIHGVISTAFSELFWSFLKSFVFKIS